MWFCEHRGEPWGDVSHPNCRVESDLSREIEGLAEEDPGEQRPQQTATPGLFQTSNQGGNLQSMPENSGSSVIFLKEFLWYYLEMISSSQGGAQGRRCQGSALLLPRSGQWCLAWLFHLRESRTNCRCPAVPSAVYPPAALGRKTKTVHFVLLWHYSEKV